MIDNAILWDEIAVTMDGVCVGSLVIGRKALCSNRKAGEVVPNSSSDNFSPLNNRGRKTSNNEVTCAPHPQATAASWHATSNLPLTVTESIWVTAYTCDTKRRKNREQTTHQHKLFSMENSGGCFFLITVSYAFRKTTKNRFQKTLKTLTLLACLGLSQTCSAQYYVWFVGGNNHVYNTPDEACRDERDMSFYGDIYADVYQWESTYSAHCITNHWGYPAIIGGVGRIGDSCPPGSRLGAESHYCENPNTLISSKNKGAPDDRQSCAISNSEPPRFAGNPINISTGNKYQVEIDYAPIAQSPISFSRFYNSIDGIWTHSYSTHLSFDQSSVTLVDKTGKQTTFTVSNNGISADPDELGKLEKSGDSWIYTSSKNETLIFNSDGKLTSISGVNAITQDLTYGVSNQNTTVTVNDNFGHSLSFTQDGKYRPGEVHTTGLDITYFYNAVNQLYRVDRIRNGQTESRIYHYEVPGKPSLLTGITDERGIRFATWAYDAQERAISSEHAGGSGKTLITYNPDGSSTVTTELGKKTTYRYQMIQGVKHITAVEGEPSANCPSSNSTFTYNDRGQVLTKTDAKGFITTHVYNDRGLETSRTEASSTPQARTTTTTWHATFNLPLTVTEGGQVTTYTYDAQGRQINRTQSAP